MVSVKVVTLSWETLMLEDNISRKCELKRDLQREYFPNVKSSGGFRYSRDMEQKCNQENKWPAK